uniref:Uncharacterized protein n=1 Tax=Timema douglasi TaxID=61478 RepID=A0A7R8V8Q9_TIMDO|nr:unnamed protein product [Timema douglasi]
MQLGFYHPGKSEKTGMGREFEVTFTNRDNSRPHQLVVELNVWGSGNQTLKRPSHTLHERLRNRALESIWKACHPERPPHTRMSDDATTDADDDTIKRQNFIVEKDGCTSYDSPSHQTPQIRGQHSSPNITLQDILEHGSLYCRELLGRHRHDEPCQPELPYGYVRLQKLLQYSNREQC